METKETLKTKSWEELNEIVICYDPSLDTWSTNKEDLINLILSLQEIGED